VDSAQQPREIVRAQLGTRGRRAVVVPHTSDRATPTAGVGPRCRL
jgi:hypothetical protein